MNPNEWSETGWLMLGILTGIGVSYVATHLFQSRPSHSVKGRRLVIYLNSNVTMSRGKSAAQAVHAALLLLRVHPGTPVIVLNGSRSVVEAQKVIVRDAGRTELRPGTLTAGASWEERS